MSDDAEQMHVRAHARGTVTRPEGDETEGLPDDELDDLDDPDEEGDGRG